MQKIHNKIAKILIISKKENQKIKTIHIKKLNKNK
jgi:hypothetical protein